MMVCSPVVVRSNEQVVDATVEVWSLNVGGTVGGSVRGYAADVPETSGVAVFVEPGAARRTASEVATGNMVELVDSEPAGAAGPPAGPHDLAPIEVRRVAEDADVEAEAAAPPEAVAADRVYDGGFGGASVVGCDEGDV